MDIKLDLACIGLAIAMHNQSAIERYESSRDPNYEAQGWQALEGGLNGKCQANWKGIRGIRRMPRNLLQPRRTGNSKVLGGIQ